MSQNSPDQPKKKPEHQGGFKKVKRSIVPSEFKRHLINKRNIINNYLKNIVTWPERDQIEKPERIFKPDQLSSFFKNDLNEWMSYMMKPSYLPDRIAQFSMFYRRKNNYPNLPKGFNVPTDKLKFKDIVYTRYEVEDGTQFEIVQYSHVFSLVIKPPNGLSGEHISKKQITSFVNTSFKKYLNPAKPLVREWSWKKENSVWKAGKEVVIDDDGRRVDPEEVSNRDNLKREFWVYRPTNNGCCWYSDPAAYTNGKLILLASIREVQEKGPDGSYPMGGFSHTTPQKRLNKPWFEATKKAFPPGLRPPKHPDKESNDEKKEKDKTEDGSGFKEENDPDNNPF